MVLCTGGVNKDIFLAALRCPEKDYLLHPVEWYKFNDRILVYNINLDIWQEVARTSLVARAGAALVGWDKTYYNINGELKPGVRTPEIIKNNGRIMGKIDKKVISLTPLISNTPTHDIEFDRKKRLR